MKTRIIWSLPALCLFVSGGFLLHAALLRLPISNWPMPFTAPDQFTMDQVILYFGIFPRASVAILAGATLGLVGALLQQLLRNPIADPSTLGISAGAQLAIVTCTLFYPAGVDGYRALVALAGAGMAAVIVFALGWRRSFDPVTMIISGMLVGITASAISAALTLSQGEYLMSLVIWNGGSLSQQNWSVARTLAIALISGLILARLLVRPLVLFKLGDSNARSLGMSLKGTRFCVAILAVVLTGIVSANVGLISFIGLAAPAFVRALGVRKPSAIIFSAPLAGGLLLWFCDGLVQFISTTTNESFPTGAVTALIGGPLLLWLLQKVHPNRITPENSAASASRSSSRQFVTLITTLMIIACLSIALGKATDGWSIMGGSDIEQLVQFRWPRLLAAAGAGSMLALSGTILQRLTGNPMASPEVIGVSGGTGIGYAATITIFPAAGLTIMFAGAGLGAMLAIVIVLAFSNRKHLPPEQLLLAGIAVSSFGSSILAALLAVGDQRSWQILAWIAGSTATATPQSAIFLVVLAITALIVSLSFGRWLTILPLGHATPLALGLPIRPVRIIMILMSGIAIGAASLLVGPLSFVGLVAPHIASRAGFTRAKDQILASFLIGAILMALADLGARTVTFPYELPLGLFAALFGAPYLVWLIGRNR
ncbi:Fe(3+)-hydroxamate ABC transporter permease FhuB [Phyllobacterium sp. SB3]|uniref:Fe(3+)-hydroxamate ABC transporter permease FhuB n=1 Tax=Phyllobacterium sp. SB3 TaxID=3156073 RepID=UPI0032AFE8E9